MSSLSDWWSQLQSLHCFSYSTIRRGGRRWLLVVKLQLGADGDSSLNIRINGHSIKHQSYLYCVPMSCRQTNAIKRTSGVVCQIKYHAAHRENDAINKQAGLAELRGKYRRSICKIMRLLKAGDTPDMLTMLWNNLSQFPISASWLSWTTAASLMAAFHGINFRRWLHMRRSGWEVKWGRTGSQIYHHYLHLQLSKPSNFSTGCITGNAAIFTCLLSSW